MVVGKKTEVLFGPLQNRSNFSASELSFALSFEIFLCRGNVVVCDKGFHKLSAHVLVGG